MLTDVTITYLELTDPSELIPRSSARTDLLVASIQRPMPELNRFFYTAVGADWYWIDRLAWTYQQWLNWLQEPGTETWVLSVAGVPAGYFELRQALPGADTEIYSFGMLPAFIGQGLGGYLLTKAVERAWAVEARRVWLHTCTLDHPLALQHYQARGFRPYKVETITQDLPTQSPGPWPQAR